ncbi:unnamed protein product, partial [Rotaria magnacalcarata]
DSSTMDQFKAFIQRSSFLCPSYSLELNSIDSEFLQLLLTRLSIPSSREHHIIRKI